MHAVEIDRRLAVVGLDDDVDPFLRLHIGILHQRHTEHVELVRVPAANDVQAGAPVTDMVHRRQRLGRIERMQQRHMDRHEQRDALGQRSETSRPGKGLERPFPHLGRAAIAAPARDRQEEIHPGAVGNPAGRNDVVPFRLPGLRHGRKRQAAFGIGGKNAQLEAPFCGVRHRVDDGHYPAPSANSILYPITIAPARDESTGPRPARRRAAVTDCSDSSGLLR